MRWILIGSVLGGLGVALGAFGAHGLQGRLEALDLQIFETAARYQLLHAIVLLCVGIWASSGKLPPQALPTVNAAGWAFSLGIAVFSGSLYALVATGVRKFGMVTPLGGLGMIVGWALLAWAAVQTMRQEGG